MLFGKATDCGVTAKDCPGFRRRRALGAALRAAGADIVATDLLDLVLTGRKTATISSARNVPLALESFGEIKERISDRRVIVFLDYDGTLTPIVSRPELAILDPEARNTIRALGQLCPVAVISGREREDVARLVGLDNLFYAGSHGFDIAGPADVLRQPVGAVLAEPVLRQAESQLRRDLAGVDGLIIEGKSFAVAVHYRLVDPAEVAFVRSTVASVVGKLAGIEFHPGKKIFDILPSLDWDKGKAIEWLRLVIGGARASAIPIYLGDDRTDEDAFREVKKNGIGILISSAQRPTLAHYRLCNPDEVHEFLALLITILSRGTG